MMPDRDTTIRPATPDDWGDLQSLYGLAFPDEDLLPLVQQLLLQSFSERPATLSRCMVVGGQVIGHAAFTECKIQGADGRHALLGPVAVLPDHQRKGMGSELINDGLDRLRTSGFGAILVLGNPTYYARFGFSAKHAIAAPYPLKAEWLPAWQVIYLDAEKPKGRLIVPEAWQNMALWQ
jgi:putative acetyltransferase